jgi:type VI secretion system secreted protein VgrG
MPDKQLYLYVTTPADEDGRKFDLMKIQGEEQISGLFRYTLMLRSEDGNVDFKKMVGQPVTVTIEMYNGAKRYINGIVSRFMQGAFDGNITTYYAEIRSWLWQLTLTSNSKIFQNQSVLDIIKEVFSDSGFTDFEEKTIRSYPPREYCVQYQETAYAFVSRLMEDEGIFYFFKHEDGKHTLVIADDLDAHEPCPGLEYARMRYASLQDRTDDIFIIDCTLEQQMIPNKYATEDFNFETPHSDLLTSVDGKEKGKFRIYEYPGNYGVTGDGEKISDKRIEMYELPQKILKGEGFCRAFIAGYKFDLEEHERQDMNISYVLKQLSVNADQDEYRNTFEAFPADVPFRPARTAAKPKIVGTQTAIVVGKSGEEIWTDQYGRVKVQFHWDQEGKRDENSSCWVRVTQTWAGKGWGTLFIPRIGAEVIVSFLEGDPDRPIITGTVYNASQVVPYNLPAEKTKSTMKTNSSLGGGGFNEIRFEDKKGKEEIFTHAQKDQNEVVENNMSTTVKANQSIMVNKNKTETVGMNKAESIGIGKALSIGAAYQISVGGAMNTTVALGQAEEVGLIKQVVVGKKFELTCGKGKIIVEKSGKITIKGTEFEFTASGPVKINGSVIDLN